MLHASPDPAVIAQVRFENARHVTDAVVKALSTMLAGSPWLGEASRLRQVLLRVTRLAPRELGESEVQEGIREVRLAL